MSVYKFYQSRLTEAWYQLPEAEQKAHTAKCVEALTQVGGKQVLLCTPVWSTEQWLLCGVEEFPNVEAVQAYSMMLYQLGHFRYYQGTSMLAMQMPEM